MNNNRIVSVDMLKIFSMFMVLLVHSIYYGLYETYLFPMDGSSCDLHFFLDIIKAYSIELVFLVASTCVNCFILCTGYLTISREGYGLNSLMRIYIRILFYTLCLMFLSYLLFDSVIDYKCFFPLLTGKYWFCSAYFAMMFMAPFVSKLSNNIKRKEYLLLLLVLYCLTTWPLFGRLHHENMKPLFFVFVYLLGGFLKLYYYDLPKIIKAHSLSVLLLFLVTITSAYLLYTMCLGEFKLHMFSYNNIITLTLSVLFFVNFQKISPSKIIRFISKLAPYTFSVYLIHSNQYVWPLFFTICQELPPSYFAISNLIFCVIVFFICILIDIVVEKVFVSLHVYKYIKTLSGYLERKLTI